MQETIETSLESPLSKFKSVSLVNTDKLLLNVTTINALPPEVRLPRSQQRTLSSTSIPVPARSSY
ncbi:hypothetical protein ACP0HM_12855 [Escherichia coli]